MSRSSRRCRRGRRPRAPSRVRRSAPVPRHRASSRTSATRVRSGSVTGVDPHEPRPAARRRPAPAAGRRGRRVPRLAARTARSDQRRRRVRHGHPDRVAVRVRAAARTRPSTSTRRRSARSCRTSGRSCRRSPGPRSSRPTRGRSSARSGWPACARRSGVCASRSCGSPSDARSGAAGADAGRVTGRRSARVPRPRPCACRRRDRLVVQRRRGGRSGCGRAGPGARHGTRRS